MTKLTSRLLLAAGAFALTACATTDTGDDMMTDAASSAEAMAKDPREGLAGGMFDAETVILNMERTAALPRPDGFTEDPAMFSPEARQAMREAIERGERPRRRVSPLAFANTDLAFSGDRVIVGSYHGMNIYDVSDDTDPELIMSLVCPGGQGDVSIHGNLVFMSVEQNRGRLDCGVDGAEGDVNEERFRGIRIFDISDLSNPVQVGAVQTCRGSHTHTLIPHPSNDGIVYVYNQGTSRVRSGEELAGCINGQPEDAPDTSLYSIDIIEVPVSAPQNARIIDSPRLFADVETGEIAGLWRGGDRSNPEERSAQTNHCHDITAYPEMGLAAGACSGNGLLIDISDPANPRRIDDLFDPNMAYWHSATFNNDATKVIFSDEWGGGVAPRCTPESPDNWGANTITLLNDGKLEQRAYFKIPNVQSAVENCVSHNGSIIPVPGRDIMVQAWYQGGISIFDFTDADNPYEIGYFDQGPVSEEMLRPAGYWSVYWHNGRIYGAEIARGFDVFKLLPSEFLTEAEIAAAELIQVGQANTQTQERYEWPDEPVVARAYADHLKRKGVLSGDMAEAVYDAISSWEATGEVPANLSGLALQLDDLDVGPGAAAARDGFVAMVGRLG